MRLSVTQTSAKKHLLWGGIKMTKCLRANDQTSIDMFTADAKIFRVWPREMELKTRISVEVLTPVKRNKVPFKSE